MSNVTDVVIVLFLEGFMTLGMLTPVIVPIVVIAVAMTAGATPSKHPRPIPSRFDRSNQ